ncbi:MAG: hypothetical protein IKJ11_00200 [Clostridia bacterium]|nr:hypothetical protein [Clostridia bacterium]
MSTARALFPGAMGPDGFISCFDHLIPEQNLRRMLILKGGPGVGKSTFMRRIHAALTENGEQATLYFCSGDPDSLDAVAVEEHGLLILDGTAPHIVDPRIPGARDSIINLGACLNERAMRARLSHIRACMADHADASRRARAFMRASRALWRDNADTVSACIDERRLARMTAALISAVLPQSGAAVGAAHMRPVITDALTPKGEICLLTQSAQQRIIRVVHHFAMDPTPVFKALSRAAQAAGFDVEEHLLPTAPGAVVHLTIPSLDTLVTTSDKLTAEQTFDFSACLPSGSLLRRECALEQARSGIIRSAQHAVSAMAQAKQLHDELETFYVPNMDFTRWQEILDETLKSLQTAGK